MILDNSFSDAVLNILSANEYKFDIKMYDEYLTPTLLPEKAVWIYIKKQNTFLKMPKVEENDCDLVIYIMNNEIITLIKHAIKRIRAIAAQYGVLVTINVLSNKNRKKTFTNIVGKYIEQKDNSMNESVELERDFVYSSDNLIIDKQKEDMMKNMNKKETSSIRIASRTEVLSVLKEILPKIKDQLDYLKDK